MEPVHTFQNILDPCVKLREESSGGGLLAHHWFAVRDIALQCPQFAGNEFETFQFNRDLLAKVGLAS